MDKNKEIDKILQRIQVNAGLIHRMQLSIKRFEDDSAELRARLAEIEGKP